MKPQLSLAARAGTALTVLLVLGAAAPAHAEIIKTIFSGNDCADGNSPNCVDITELTGSPFLAKRNALDNGGFDEEDGLVDAAKFTITYDAATRQSGTWSYNPSPTDLAVLYFVVKAGNGFILYENVENNVNVSFGNGPVAWSTVGLVVGQGETPNLSHISWYDTGGNNVPEPASAALLGGGLIGLSWASRRRRQA